MEIIEIISEQVLVFDDGGTVLVLDAGEVEILDVAQQGPVGPAGAVGYPGNYIYEHTQPTAATEWIINHNLGYRPAIEILDAGGNEIDANVLHISPIQARIYFNLPAAGTARCN